MRLGPNAALGCVGRLAVQCWLELLGCVWVVFHLGLLLDDGADAGRSCSTPHSLALVGPGCSQARKFCAEGPQFGHPLLNGADLPLDEVEYLATGRFAFGLH